VAFQRLLAHVTNIRYYGAKATMELTASQLAMMEEDARDHEQAMARLLLKQTLIEEGVLNPEMQYAPFTLQHVLPGARVVVISSRTQGFQDFVQVLQERRALLRVYLLPTLVQGEHAPEQIAHALSAKSCQPGTANVVALIRGGGDATDLAAFSAPVVVRAIARCEVQTLSGVGHSTDQTLTDFAVDHAAITPSMAAVALCSAQEGFLTHRSCLSHRARHLCTAVGTENLDMAKGPFALPPLLQHHSQALCAHEKQLVAAVVSPQTKLRGRAAQVVRRLWQQMEVLGQQGLLERQLLRLGTKHMSQSCAVHMHATNLRANARRVTEFSRGVGLAKRRQALQNFERMALNSLRTQTMKRTLCTKAGVAHLSCILRPWEAVMEQYRAMLLRMEERMSSMKTINVTTVETEVEEAVAIYRQCKRIRRAVDLKVRDAIRLVFPDGIWHATCDHVCDRVCDGVCDHVSNEEETCRP
jgi:exodeoxyribonuclease VII large subunit